MLNNSVYLNDNIFNDNVEQKGTRDGFGIGLVEAGKIDKNVVALCADLTDSTRMAAFAETFPDRFVEIGVAEQNLVTVASGMAAMGKIPFTASYAAFSPGRNWEQIRTTICLNDQPVKVIGPHAGVSVGPDGATHQMLEDIALMRVLPNMVVVVPTDSIEAHKATLAIAKNNKPSYLRLAREKSPIITTDATPFEIGKAYVYKEGADVSIIACGSMVYQSLVAARLLVEKGIDAEVINCPSIKPLDTETILASVRKTKCVVTCEEAQINGGLGGAIAELLGEEFPVLLKRVGMRDRFGESGKPDELLEHFGLKGHDIAKVTNELVARKKSP
jgi:transketolase